MYGTPGSGRVGSGRARSSEALVRSRLTTSPESDVFLRNAERPSVTPKDISAKEKKDEFDSVVMGSPVQRDWSYPPQSILPYMLWMADPMWRP